MTRKSSDTPYTIVDDALYDELVELTGQKVVHIELWDDSVADELQNQPAQSSATSFDFDIYLDDGIYFELYSATCYVDPEGEPIQGNETVRDLLLDFVRQGLWLNEIAVDEGDALVLVLGQHPNQTSEGATTPQLYIAIAGWLIEEWDELPDG